MATAFIPRIERRNHGGIDRALQRPGQLSLYGGSLDLPWAIVEAGWAATKPPVLDHLRAAGTRLVFDTRAWRFRDARAWAIPAARDAAWAPPNPLTASDTDALRQYVRRDLLFQAALNPDAYLVPGWIPEDRTDDITRMTHEAVQAAVAFYIIPAKPCIGFIGAHASNPDAAWNLVGGLHRGLAAVYVQLTPVDPLRDGAAKIADLVALLRAIERSGLPVIAGHLGGIGTVLRAMGISACDAGLGEGESFSLAKKLTPPTTGDAPRGRGGRGSRFYVRPLGRSVDGLKWAALLEVGDLRGRLRCGELCCRFRSVETTFERAVEHSVYARTVEAAALARLAVPLRIDAAADQLEEQRFILAACNTALDKLGERRINPGYLEHQLAALDRVRPPRAA